MTRRQVAGRLLTLLRPLAPLMAVSASARVVNQGLGVVIPAVAAALVVSFATGSGVGGFISLLAGLAVIKGTFRYLEQFTGHAVAFRLLSELRVDTFRNVVPLAPAGLEEERTGDLVARVIGDIDRVEPFYAHTIAPLASAVTVPILAAAGLAIWVDPVVATVFVAFPLSIVLAAPWVAARRVADLSAEMREEGGETTALFTDSVQGAREVAVFRARDEVADRVAQQSRTGTTVRRSLARLSAWRSGLTDLSAGLAVVAVTAVGAARFDAGIIDLAALAAAIVVAWVGTTPAGVLVDIVPDLEEALAAANRLFDLSDREPPVEDPIRPVPPGQSGSVSWKDVTVRYPRSDQTALDGITAFIEENRYMAVVGPSGSGKSTLVELLVRFRDPDRGRVQLGGTDIKSMEPGQLREAVMLVPQRPDIFYGTIADNLRLGKENATDAELLEALDRAALGSWITSLEKGLATPTGELGETMSGGQRQRLAIARAFLRDPSVLILDEATSELDVETERHVLDEIARERGERTLIVVAHRLESVIDADEILVLDNGRLVERGSHADLSEAGGVYSGLWRRYLDLMLEIT